MTALRNVDFVLFKPSANMRGGLISYAIEKTQNL